MNLTKVRELAVRDHLVLIQFVALAAILRVTLPRFPLARVLAFTRAHARPGLEIPMFSARLSLERVNRLANAAVRITGREAHCLRYSLLMFVVLRSRGECPKLAIGVKMSEQGFAAHAWIESRSISTGHSGIDGFQRLYSVS